MEKVVYILGAGFSKPFGLPLMADFYTKSKDMCEHNPQLREHFEDVFTEMGKIHKSSDYYETDVFNIEDILSILEINQHIGVGSGMRQKFENYIKEVIRYYTPDYPEFPNNITWGSGWPEILFDRDKGERQHITWTYYGFFVGSIFNLSFYQADEETITARSGYRDSSPNASYSLITLNYDLILEYIRDHINKQYCHKEKISFAECSDEKVNDSYRPGLAKLHGSVDTNIISPTWNKGVIKDDIISAWKLAYKTLVSANCLRIIGYSLPITDTYARYLLRSTVIESFNLKQIDVICKDDDGSVKAIYDHFIKLKFPHYRFANAKVEDYLHENYRLTDKDELGHHSDHIYMDRLEQAHKRFMEEKSHKDDAQ
ncbi:SIR2 family protein [Candidatus Poribacteria bacterium]